MLVAQMNHRFALLQLQYLVYKVDVLKLWL